MFEKTTILIIIFALLVAFYLVISLSAAGTKSKANQSSEIKSYLNNVRALIFFLGSVSFILWLFL
tara:strand:+ start:181 stop:375 length:195 start_codon:yes stop_codon:yes gene_type:complete